MCIVLALEAHEGPNTQEQARRVMAETGHHLVDLISPITRLVLLETSLANHRDHH